MITNLTIKYSICRANLGESDDDYAEQYINALTEALRAEYPMAEITVDLLGNTFSETVVDGNGDEADGDFIQEIRENTHMIANLVAAVLRAWDQMC